MDIKGRDLRGVIEPHFHDLIDESADYIIRQSMPQAYLSPNRFDVGFKLAFIDFLEVDLAVARDVYLSHIAALTLGEFKEPGSQTKDTPKSFIDEFLDILKSFDLRAFDPTETVIPVAANGVIANGAHRLAAAVYFDKEISTTQIQCGEHKYDFEFFRRRGVEDEFIDLAALSLLRHLPSPRVAIVWPSAGLNKNDVRSHFDQYHYVKKLTLNHRGSHGLVCLAYRFEEWLGTPENNFGGGFEKQNKCFSKNGDCIAVLFDEPCDKKVRAKKEQIRAQCKVGKHSIHITDTREEAMLLGSHLFFGEAENFLNSGLQTSQNVKEAGLEVLSTKFSGLREGMINFQVLQSEIKSDLNSLADGRPLVGICDNKHVVFSDSVFKTNSILTRKCLPRLRFWRAFLINRCLTLSKRIGLYQYGRHLYRFLKVAHKWKS